MISDERKKQAESAAIPKEQKAKLEQMARNHGGYSTREGWIEVSTPHSVEQYLAGCEAAWDMAVQYATEKERERIKRELGSLGLWIHVNPRVLNPPEQKEEGEKV